MGGRAKAAQVYPPKLCTAIVAGFAKQLRLDTAPAQVTPPFNGGVAIASLTPQSEGESDRTQARKQAGTTPKAAEAPVFNLEILQVDADDTKADLEEDQWIAEDDVHGGTLPAHLVLAARNKEINYLLGRKVYSYATDAEAWTVTRKKPLKLKWIDSNKGDRHAFNVRSRLVCTEIRRKGIESIFSATPPLESLRILLARAASEPPVRPCGRRNSDPYKIQLIDVSRAHFYADAVRDVYIQLPAEDPRSGEPGVCGKLEKTMYGTLDAAERWGEHYAATLTKVGSLQGTASPCHFYHPGRDIWLLVHGDDFVTVARQAGREYTQQVLSDAYEIKVDIAGPEPEDPKEIKILGRIVTFTPEGIQYEPDPGHVEKVIFELGLTESNGVATPGVRDETTVTAAELLERRRCYAPPRLEASPGLSDEEPEEEAWPLLAGAELSRYQSLAASLNYFPPDRLDLMFAVKELMRKLSKPNDDDWQKLKRVARYLLTAPRLVMMYPWQALSDTLKVYTDADHAGCLRTRKSTSGGVVMWGPALLKAWSRTQTLIGASPSPPESRN